MPLQSAALSQLAPSEDWLLSGEPSSPAQARACQGTGVESKGGQRQLPVKLDDRFNQPTAPPCT